MTQLNVILVFVVVTWLGAFISLEPWIQNVVTGETICGFLIGRQR